MAITVAMLTIVSRSLKFGLSVTLRVKLTIYPLNSVGFCRRGRNRSNHIDLKVIRRSQIDPGTILRAMLYMQP